MQTYRLVHTVGMCCEHSWFDARLCSYRVSHNDVMLSDNCDRLFSGIERLQARRCLSATERRFGRGATFVAITFSYY